MEVNVKLVNAMERLIVVIQILVNVIATPKVQWVINVRNVINVITIITIPFLHLAAMN